MDWERQILDNSVRQYLWVAGIMLLTLVLNRYVSSLVNKLIYLIFRRLYVGDRFKQFEQQVLGSMQWLLMLLVFVFALETLNYPQSWRIQLFGVGLFTILHKIKWAVLLLAVLAVGLNVTKFVLTIWTERARAAHNHGVVQIIPFLGDLIRVLLYLIFFFVLLGGIFNINITSLLAGIGLGGLAIAFAAQESIKDLFGSLTIFFDKPFTVGDVVRVNGVEGTVEAIGFRSTRIRTYDQTFVTVPNKRMLESNVDNLSNRSHRRVRSVLRLSYRTPPDALHAMVTDLRTLFSAHPVLNTMSVSVAVDELTLNGIQLVVTYFVPMMDWDKHMLLKEEINLKLLEVIHRHGGQLMESVGFGN